MDASYRERLQATRGPPPTPGTPRPNTTTTSASNDWPASYRAQGIQGVATLTVTEEADKVTLSWPAQTTLADGSAVLSYGLLVSGDGGATWQALASRIRGTSHSVRPRERCPSAPPATTRCTPRTGMGDRDLPFATAKVEDVVVRTNTVTRTETVVQTETVVETVTVAEDPYAYFADEETTRTVPENSAPGTPVGAPVTVLRNSGNEVAYSLEGPDAALFTIEQDTGQILVGEGALLDYESGTTGYTVEVVATPSSGDTVRATVTISVVDAPEAATVAISPAGQPQAGQPLTATLTHSGGEPGDPRWQWQRSAVGGLWLNIAGATLSQYTPTEEDSGRRLRALATYREPQGGQVGLAGAVTEALPGEEPAPETAARFDANNDGRIDLSETLAAIAAYFREETDSDSVLEVIGAYFAG